MEDLTQDMPPRAPDGGEEESYAFERLVDFLKQRAVMLGPRPQGPFTRTTGRARPADAVESLPEAESVESVEVAAEALEYRIPPNFRSHLLEAYREKQAAAGEEAAAEAEAPVSESAALPAPANNWIPRGPSVLRKGQAANRPAVSGRIPGVAVARGGERVYVASANGGVWRSDDAGLSWRPTMETWDLDPTTHQSDTLACGAIAIDLDDPDRVYVGTGEGDSVAIDGGSLIGTYAYFGVGPVRSDDGGRNWHTEPFAPGS